MVQTSAAAMRDLLGVLLDLTIVFSVTRISAEIY